MADSTIKEGIYRIDITLSSSYETTSYYIILNIKEPLEQTEIDEEPVANSEQSLDETESKQIILETKEKAQELNQL